MWHWAPASASLASSPRSTVSGPKSMPRAATFGGNEYWYALRYAPQTRTFQQAYASGDIRGRGSPCAPRRSNPAHRRRSRRWHLRLHDQATKALVSSIAGAGRGGLTRPSSRPTSADGSSSSPPSVADGNHVDAGWCRWRGPGRQPDGWRSRDRDRVRRTVMSSCRQPHRRNYVSRAGRVRRAPPKAADIDGDGRDELIAADPWYIVWAYDVDRQLPRWSIASARDIGAIPWTTSMPTACRDCGDGQGHAQHRDPRRWSSAIPGTA